MTELSVEGLQSCEAQPVAADSSYKAPHGAMKAVVRCRSEKITLDKPLTISWTLRYR